MNSKSWATEDPKKRAGEKPHQEVGLALSFFGIGLMWWSLRAGSACAQEQPALKKAVTVAIHCYISTPEVEPLVKDLLTIVVGHGGRTY